MTNNAAEYQGLIRGLAMAREHGATRLDVRSDSELLVFQLNGIYKIKAPHLADLAAQARTLASEFASVRYIPIPREQNTEADRLANRAMDDVEAGVMTPRED